MEDFSRPLVRGAGSGKPGEFQASTQKKTGPLGPGFPFVSRNQVYSGPTPLPQRMTDRAIIATSTTSPTASTELENRNPSSL